MNFIVSFQKIVTRMSTCGGTTSGSSTRLMEDVVKSGIKNYCRLDLVPTHCN